MILKCVSGLVVLRYPSHVLLMTLKHLYHITLVIILDEHLVYVNLYVQATLCNLINLFSICSL